MKLTKLEHSGFYVEEAGRELLLDPVEYVAKVPDFAAVDAVVITHKHSDHYQPEVLRRVVAANPGVVILAPEDCGVGAGVLGAGADAGADFRYVRPGDKVEVGAWKLEFFGSYEHAPVFDGVSPCQNVGVVVNGALVDAGDSFDAPEMDEIPVLLVPMVAPWMRIEDAAKYIERVRPKMAVNAHDGLLSEMGAAIMNNCVRGKAAEVGTEYRYLKVGEGVEI